MNIKSFKSTVVASLLLSAAVTGCSDWTDAEALQKNEYSPNDSAMPEAYYQALRDYKNTAHSISFGWFDNWTEPGADYSGSLMGVPDSMDVVSLWAGSSNLKEWQVKDLKMVQKKKGTRVVPCSFTSYIGQGYTPAEYNTDDKTRNEFWGWVDGDDAAIEAAIKKYAKAIIDTLNKYDYDGFDIDYEPHYGYGGPLASNNARMHILISELGKYIGPMSEINPEKLLIVDGEPQSLNAETGPYISYFVIQAYSGTGGNPAGWRNSVSNLDGRLNKLISKFGSLMGEEVVTNRTVMTENLEPALEALNGGYQFTDRNGACDIKEIPSMLGMAMWEPLNGFRKGGFGAYKFNNESVNKPHYKWMRRGIQAQNPAIK